MSRIPSNRTRTALVCLCAGLTAACCVLNSRQIVWAQEQQSSSARDEQQIIPPAKKGYKGREIAVTMHYLGAPWLMRDERQREEDCAMLLKALDVKPGQVVCDMGCGNGFYTLQLARLVGE